MNLLYLLAEAAEATDGTLNNIGNPDGFCHQTAVIWQLVGKIMMVLRIVFPILVIIFGIIDIGKSVTNSKPEEVKKSFINLAWRLGAAVAIFFIPTIVGFVISLANGFSEVEKDYKICAACISKPNSTDCDISDSKVT